MPLRYYRVTLVLGPAGIVLAAELVRHQFGLPYVSMSKGNWLMALLTAVVITLFSQGLFRRFEAATQSLARERAARAVMEERERLARELHDQIAQTLFSIGIQLEALRQASAGTDADRPEIEEAWREIRVALREVDDNVRQVIFHLRRPLDDGPDLHSRLRALLTQAFWSQDIRWEVRMDPSVRLTPAEEVQLFGIAQEAIANVKKHSGATRVRVALESNPAGGWAFRVEDDGRGFQPGAGVGHYGIQIMASRANEIGACLEMEPAAPGTTVRVVKPG
jgi:signal transduction histidine kinase